MKSHNSLSEKDRRNDERKACFFAEVDYAVGKEVYTDAIKNISNSGVFIETSDRLDVGTDLKMLFSDFSNIDLIQISGDIVRTMPNGVAVKFDMSSTNQKREMKSYIAKI